MDFNFQEQYKSYSNVELLKITERPGDYQQAAVVAAQQVLSEREVSVEDREFAATHYAELERSQQVNKELVDLYKNKAKDLLEPVLQPKEDVSIKNGLIFYSFS